MRKIWFLCFILFFLTCNLSYSEEILSFPKFGKVHVYRESPHPDHVILFVSGDGGWNLGVVDMAQQLSRLDALVVGIDIVRYTRAAQQTSESCFYPAADFEALSKFVQKTFEYPSYRIPVLIGYSSGATLVYATLAQAPPNTFAGAISLGFCPDLPATKPYCPGQGLKSEPGVNGKGVNFLPAKSLETPWIALQGTIDQVCKPEVTRTYVQQVPAGEIVLLPGVGHGYSVPRKWMPQFEDAFRRITTPSRKPAPTDADVKDLPVVTVPSNSDRSDFLAVIISGDGGWASLDRSLANEFSAHGIPVVGLNSLQYFWTARNPEEASRALARILEHYLTIWNKKQAILIGYSFGSDVLPFMASRLPENLLGKILLISLIGPSSKASFEFHLSDWLSGFSSADALPVKPEVEKLKSKKILCVYGDKEEGSLCPFLGKEFVTPILLKGGHHLGGDYRFIAAVLLKAAILGK